MISFHPWGFYTNSSDTDAMNQSEIGGHACPRLVRPVSVSAIFQKIHVRVRVRVRGVKKLHVRVRVRVRDLKKFHVHVRVRVRDLKNFYVRVREFTSR